MTRYVILGDGAAGLTAAQTLRAFEPTASIKIISDDPHPAYYRAALTNYLLGELRDEQIWAVPPTFFPDLGVERVLGRVTAVDTQRNNVWTSAGAEPYDALFVGTGARARPAPFEGSSLAGVGTLRTLQDTRWVMDVIKLHGLKRAVAVGGGALGLEWALAMHERGVHVTMMVRERGLMGGALDDVASDLLLARLRQGGLDVRMQDEVLMAQPGPNGSVGAVRTKAGDVIPCELVAVAIGVMPNTEFLQGTGVVLGKRGGVAVDDRLRSSVPNVFAGGDVAEVNGQVLQLWEPARRQAQVAATNMTKRDLAYAPGVQYFATRLFDLDFASIGAVGRDPGAEELVEVPRNTGKISYRKVVIKNGRLIGALFLGDRASGVRKGGRLFKYLVDEGVDVSGIKTQLLDPAFDLAAWLRSRSLVDKPKELATGAAEMMAPAQMRGTQHVNLQELLGAAKGKLAQPQAQAQAMVPPTANVVPATPQPIKHAEPRSPGNPGNQTILSIGLKLQQTPSDAMRISTRSWLEGAGQRFELSSVVTSIGRDPAGSIALTDAGVSHVHAQVTLHAGALFLRDLGSRNGTYVNGKQVTLPHKLVDGDRLTLGNAQLLFRTMATSAPEPSHPAVAPIAPIAPIAPPVVSSQASSQRIAKLIGQSGVAMGQVFVLGPSPVTLGRDVASHVRIDDLSISRRHAVMNEIAGRWSLTDLHSSAGTTHRGVRVEPGRDTPLQDGDVVQLGAVSFTFRAS